MFKKGIQQLSGRRPGAEMTDRTFHVTASMEGWRSLPWPFGLLDVTDTGLRIHSWHWSWWMADRVIPRESIETVEVSKSFGTTTLTIKDDKGGFAKVMPASSSKRVLEELRHHGYLLT